MGDVRKRHLACFEHNRSVPAALHKLFQPVLKRVERDLLVVDFQEGRSLTRTDLDNYCLRRRH